MTPVKIEPITASDANPVREICYNLRDGDRHEAFAQMRHDSAHVLAHNIIHDWGPLSYIVYRYEKPVAVLGAMEMWPGVWSAWLLATDDFSKVGKTVTAFIHRDMSPLLRALGCHRLEARSLATHTEAHRWLESLGAKREALLKNYGKNKEDFIIFHWDE